MTETPQVLLTHYLKTLKLPTFLKEYGKVAQQCAVEGVDYENFLLRLFRQQRHRKKPYCNGSWYGSMSERVTCVIYHSRLIIQ